MTRSVFSLLIACSLLCFASCKVDPQLTDPLPVNNLQQTIPAGWPQPVYQFSNNPISENTFALGRGLFYEPMLSKDNTISCGDCHQNFVAFANAGHDISHGIEGRQGNRNSPALFNLAWHPYYMHDGGSVHLEIQPLAPIQNPVEMDESIGNIIKKLQASVKYKSLFNSAYGNDTINSERILKSLAQFMALIYSYNSKFDYWKRGEKGIRLTEQELRGYNQFQQKCNSCHKEPLFSDFAFRNNGLRVNPTYHDSGRARVTGLPEDRHKYKTPSLRNIALSKPYMHDGRYSSLEICLNHYTDSIQNFENLDPSLIQGISLSPEEKKDIIAFLLTLTDYEIINDKRFANPNFK